MALLLEWCSIVIAFHLLLASSYSDAPGDEAQIPEENDVLILNKDNFDEVITTKDIILVEFYAPWCGHCKNLAKEYEPAAHRMKENDPPVPFAKVDATVETELATRFSVTGYPTLKIFRKGQAYEYEGPRTEGGIVDYMKEQADPNWKPPPETVISLQEKDFNDFVNADIVLVEFYAPWCGHCKRLAPEYERASRRLKEREIPILLAKVDATVETNLAQKYNVQGYPTLKIFRNGEAFDYKGPQDEAGIVDYMIKQSGEPSVELTSLKQLQQFLSKDDVTIIGFFKNKENSLFEIYRNTCNDLRDDYKFGHSFVEEINKNYNVDRIYLFHPERFQSKFEKSKITFDKVDATRKDLTTFYETYATPLVGERNYGNSEKRYKKRPLVVVYYTVDWSFEHKTATQFWREKVLAVAKDYSDITFAISDEDLFQNELKDLGLDDSGEEINVGLFDSQGKKYKMEPEDDFESDALRDFIKKYKAGKLKPHMKSQPVPKRNDGPVKIVVGKSFSDIVLDTSKDVLIEFYAPWCGHCKKLEPIYTKLGKKFKDEKKLVIAKIDATANDVPGEYPVSGYPTIYFATKDHKENPIKYEGQRDFQNLSEFVEKHTTVQLGSSKKDEL